MNEDRNYVSGVSKCSLSLETMGFITFIVFLILKLTNTWDINWFWVWFPLWIPLAISAVLIVVAVIFLIIVVWIEEKHGI